jgi:hypothetical protein
VHVAGALSKSYDPHSGECAGCRSQESWRRAECPEWVDSGRLGDLDRAGLFCQRGSIASVTTDCSPVPPSIDPATEDDNPDLAADVAAGRCPPCPCCGGRMIIVESFGRGGQPRAPPSPQDAVKTASHDVRYRPPDGPRVPSWEAFGRRPSERAQIVTTGRHPKPFTRADLLSRAPSVFGFGLRQE